MFKPKRETPASAVRTLWQMCLEGICAFWRESRVSSLESRKALFASVVLAFVLLTLPLFSFTRVHNAHVSALASDNLNFQARLASAGGAIVQDGYYNIEFKLYDDPTAGNLLWTETHAYNSGAGNCSGPVGVNDCRVRVVNGYVSVYLGSITSFPADMPWDQQLYLTMNVGGTVTSGSYPTMGDGEMTPRLKLTAVPYAMEAKKASQLTTSNGALQSNLSIEAPTVGNQTFVIQDQGAAGTYNVLLEENAATILAADFIQNQNAAQQTANFWISGTARADTSVTTPLIDTATAVALNIGTTNATSISLNKDTTLAAGKSITVTGGNTASRPASPTEGMVYYDTTTKQLLTYANGKWQADRSTATKIVAASNSSQAIKDSADYIADGTADDVEINAALTAATGGKVYLAEGTYYALDTILVPNNTILAGAGRGTLIYLVEQDSTGDNLIENSDTATGTGVVIQDLRLNGQRALQDGANQQSAIYLRGMGDGNGASARAGAVMRNLWIESFDYGGIQLVSFTGNDNNTVTNVVFQDNDGSAAVSLALGASNNLITNNKFYGNVLAGVEVFSGSYNTISNNDAQSNGTGIKIGDDYNTITNNTLNANARGIDASGSYNIISNNSVTANTYAGLYISQADHFTISGNNLSDNTNYSMYLSGTYYSTVADNIIKSSGSDGIYATNTGSNDILISGNIISGSAQSAIELWSTSNIRISDNKLHDNGGATTNDAVLLTSSNKTTIMDNDITDTAASSNNYAININNAGSSNNYVSGNFFSSTPGTSTIRDLGTGTTFANQPMAENGMNMLNRSLNSTTAFSIQGTDKVNVFNVDTTNGEIELGSSALAGKLVISDGSSNNVTISLNALAGDYTLAIPTITGNDTFCLASLANCANGTMFIQNQNASQQTANYWVSGAARADTSVLTPSLDRATAGTLSIGTNGTNTTAITIGNATAATSIVSNTTNLGTDGGTIVLQATSGAAGNGLTIKGGAATSGNTNGGILTLSGGAGNGSGVMGLVNLSPTAFTAVGSTQSFSGSGSLTAGLVDTYSTITVTSTGAGVVVTIPAPATGNQTVGRVLYIAAANGSNDFGILLAGTSINIAMKANSTATLIWNGTGWTAAGASSSTDLQSAYNNTLTSAGGAELILNASGGAADGLTIRNNGTTPITGGILEVQSSIGTNLFSVNSLGTELAANGGAETSSTFATNWTAAPAGGTVSRTTTSGQYETGQAGAQVVTTATQYHGIRNNLSANPVASTTYQVSFTAKSTTANTPIDVIYSPDGGTTPIACTTYGGQTLSNTIWTKITCTITTTAAAVTNPDLIIRQTDTTARTIYVDNLSFMRNDSTTQPSNVQIGGGITGGQITLFTLDRSSAPPVANGDTTYYGSMYYDTTTGRIQCYESDGWGACGSAPDNIVVLTPEYSNAVLGAPGMLGGVPTATGVGTLTADFCSNQSGVLQVNTGFCASGISRNYYRWTSPQATSQTYSIYVSYKLPSTFKQFYDNDTVKLTALKDHATNAGASLSVFRSTGGAVTQCGSTTTITTSTSAWVTTSLIGNETSCNFTGGDVILFKIDVSANSNSSVYIENLEFRYTNV